MMFGWKVEMKSSEKVANVFNKPAAFGHYAWKLFVASTEKKLARLCWLLKMEREYNVPTLEKYCECPVDRMSSALHFNRHVPSK